MVSPKSDRAVRGVTCDGESTILKPERKQSNELRNAMCSQMKRLKSTINSWVGATQTMAIYFLACSTNKTCTTAAETYGPHMGCIWATYGDLVCNIWSFFNIWGRKSFRKHNIWATYGSLFQTYGVLLKHIGPF